MRNIIIQLVTAFIGAFGFAFLFNVRVKLAFYGAVGGFFGWAIFLICEHFIGGIFLPCLIAAAFLELYAEVLSRILKAPATVLFIPAIIPLIPGGSLFQTMLSAVKGDFEAFWTYGSVTAQYTVAIAAGMSIVWSASYIIRKAFGKRRQNITSL